MPHNIPFVGNLTHDIKDELQMETNSSVPRLYFRIIVNSAEHGSKKRTTNFFGFTAFGSTAENMARSFKKGDRLIVLARTDTYQREVSMDGRSVNLTIPSFKATNVGPDLTWASAEIMNRHGDDGSDASASKANAKSALVAKFPCLVVDEEVF